MEFMKMIKDSVIKLLGNKEVKEIIKFIATTTVHYACNKFNITRYKYDITDLKTMVYNHNLNNNDKIKYDDVNEVVNLLSIKRFVDDLGQQITMSDVVNEISRLCNDTRILQEYDKIQNDNKLLSFDLDTLETTSIADNYEISSGGIYVPNRDIITITKEGEDLSNAKNDYLEERIKLGDNPNIVDLRNILNKYYDRIHYDEMRKSFK